ncbi:hypothetical protein [Aquimarina sediminis]|uniref:hypothetical protein n=1 Tax=Aquimarina sediminis TaxID=2070536 RepID=UPI000CA00B00|nr:hypothetical protein [Aquimarina sediminis]
MHINKKLKLAIPLFLVYSLFTYCQNIEIKKQDFVMSFFEDVFINNKSLEVISSQYRYKGSEIKSDEEANDMFKQYIIYLRTEKKHLSDKKAPFKIEPYNNSSIEDLWLFESKQRENIFVISVNGKVESYLLLKDEKIFSLLYFRKGRDSIAHFIPYYIKQE